MELEKPDLAAATHPPAAFPDEGGAARKIILLFLTAAALLLVTTTLVYRVGLTRIHAQEKAAKQLLILQHLDAFLSAMKDAETGQRGYLLTADASYLEPYSNALSVVAASLEGLGKMAVSGDLPNASVIRLSTRTGQKLTELERTVQLRRQQGLDAALAVVRDNRGKQLMDEIRGEVAGMRAEEAKEFAVASQLKNPGAIARIATFAAPCLLNLAFLAWALRQILAEVRRRAAANLEARQQKELFATTLASIGDGVVTTDADGRVAFLNQEAERLTGWKSSEAAGRPLRDVFPIRNEQTRQPVEDPVAKVMRLGGVVGMANHTVLVRRDGAEVPIDDSAAPIRVAGGPMFGVVMVFRDVSEQRKAHEGAARLAAIVEHSGDAIFTKNLDGVVQSWNASAQKLFGYRAEEIVGKPITLLVPEDRLAEEKDILARLRRGQGIERLETVRVAKDGRQIRVAVSVSPLKNAEGEVIGASKIVHDITELAAAREALVREKELLATTLASIGDAVMVTDAQGRITFLNAEAERLTKWTTAQAAGRPLQQVFRIVNEESRAVLENPVEKVIRIGGVVGLANHTVLIARDGTEVPIDDSAAPIRVAGGPLLGVVLVFRDFTQRKQADAAQARLIRMLDTGFAAFIVRDAADRITHWNRGAGQLYGWTREEALGKVTHALFKTQFPKPLSEIAADVQRQGHWEGELVHTTKDGQVITVFSRWTLERNAQGQSPSILETNMDLTERKRAETTLRESEERYRAVASITTDVVWRTDAAGDFVEPQHSWEKYTGQTWEEHHGCGWANAVHPDDRERVAEIWRRACVTRTMYESRGRLRHGPTQSWRYYIGRAMPLLNPDGTVREWIGCDADVHEQRTAEDALRQERERLALALAGAGGAVWGWDAAANRLDEWDARYRELYGFAPEDPASFETWFARIHPDDRERLIARTNQMIETPGDDLWDEEFRVLHPKRGQRWLCGLGRCYRDANGKVLRMAGVNLDVTDKREAQEVLRRGKEELEQLVAERTAKLQEFIGELEHMSYTITHDMRAPLRAMRAFAEMLKDASPHSMGEDEKGFVARIIAGAERMDLLITDALNYSKAVRAELPLGPIDAGKLLREMLATYPQFHEANADITVAPDLPPVMGNAAGLTQCFSNLLDNAVKFTPPGHKAHVRVTGEARDGWVRLSVEDNGIGISKEMLPRVFDMFARGSSPQAGTGIGLALVRKVVDRMGGRVGVESELGRGTRFWVELKPGNLKRVPAETLKAISASS